ncbi:MAG: sigma-70 family RNA polymerase sigma factor [Gaiellaceae bacterium]
MSTTTTGGRLTAGEAEALWRGWAVDNDRSARDKLVLAYSPMVRYLATRKVRELPAYCELDDLVSCGLIALMEAVDRFNPTKGASFEQYAWTRVNGAVMDELRRQDWASRSVRRTGRKIERARDALYAREGVPPTEERLADTLHMAVSELRSGLRELDRADVLSLNAPTRGGEDGISLEVGDTVEAPEGLLQPERQALAGERAKLVRRAIENLSEREQQVLAMIHVHEMQGAQVGQLLGVSESRVSQILAGVRRKLRAEVDEYEGVAAA